MINFYSTNIIVKYIKELLRTTPVPFCPIFTEKIPDGYVGLCIYKNKIIRVIREEAISKQIVLDSYYFGKNYKGVTAGLSSNQSGYDSDTHKQLGFYLRAYSAIHNINLMPFYNCVSNKYVMIDDELALLIPVVSGKTYTVAIDSLSGYSYQFLYYGRKGVVSTSGERKYISVAQFNRPTVISSPTTYKNDRCLYMALYVPSYENTSIVVLEGDSGVDYTATARYDELYTKTTEHGTEENVSPSEGLSKLSLLSINDGVNHPFADRLLEYLCGNVITSADEISKDILRVQQAVTSNSFREKFNPLYKGPVDGIWNDEIKNSLYKTKLLYDNSKSEDTVDCNGFIDKDIEVLLYK